MESAVALFQEAKLDLVSSVETLKIEVETLRVFLARLYPELAQVCPEIRDDVVRKMHPEWETRHARERPLCRPPSALIRLSKM